MTITGPIHPFVRHTRRVALDRKRAIERWTNTATAIRRHQHLNGDSDEGVYQVSAPGSWRYVGTSEDSRHLVGQVGYYAIAARGGAEQLALQLAGVAGQHERAEALHQAAWAAAPMIAATLGLGIAAGTITWDTGETVADAALRIARDSALRLLDQPNPDTRLIKARDIYRVTFADYDPPEIARMYLDRRDAIAATLSEQDIEWGGALLDAQQAAERARLSASGWRSHVSRGEGPVADEDRRWRVATVDAWRLSRPRAAATGW